MDLDLECSKPKTEKLNEKLNRSVAVAEKHSNKNACSVS
jgi:hypothetical protein